MIELVGAGYRYPGGVAVGPVDLRVAPGEIVLLTGPTGCGKSTILRLAAGLAQRHGHGVASGTVRVGGRDPGALVAHERVATVGFVGQDPDDQVFAGTLAAEVAFGPESAGLAGPELRERVAHALRAVGLEGREDAVPAELSGGQRQRAVLAAALAGGARALLLDEPLSQLDPEGALDVLRVLRHLADTDGIAILVVEHRLEAALPACDRVVLLDAGRVVADPLVGFDALHARGLVGPALAELRARGVAVAAGERAASARRPGRAAPGERGGLEDGSGDASVGSARTLAGASALVRLGGVSAGYRAGEPVLHAVDLEIHAGVRVALVGGNGAGKSTLLGVLAGRIAATGTVERAGRVVPVPQNPDLGLFCATVTDELAYAPRDLGLADPHGLAASAADALSVAELGDRPPQALSRGQRLRVAVGAAVTARPRVLLLDEPTSGQDHEQVERMLRGVREAQHDGALVFATHDLDLALRHATRILVLHGGRVAADVPPTPSALAAASGGAPIPLPPLAAWCVATGLPYGTVDEVAEHALAAGLAAPSSPSAAAPPPSPASPSPASPASASPASASPASASLAPPRPVRGDPRAGIVALFLLGTALLALDGPVPLGIPAAVAVVGLLRTRGMAGWRARFLVGLALLTWSTVLSQGLFYADWPRTPLVTLGPLTIWREGMAHGLTQSLRFTAMLAAGVWLAVATPTDRLVAGLRALRVPYGLTLMAVAVVRFVPLVGGEWLAVRATRAARGRPAWQRSPWAWLALEVDLLRPVAARAVRRARALAESLETRGFHPTAPRAVHEPLAPTLLERLGIGGLAVATLGALGLRAVYVAYGLELYYHPSLRPVYAFVRAWL